VCVYQVGGEGEGEGEGVIHLYQNKNTRRIL
jgi:hypothetical protein